MVKNKNKHNFWKRLHFKYRISVLNENTLEEVWKTKTSIFSGIAIIFLFAVLLIGTTSVFIITTPIRYYLPGYMDSEVRGQAITTSIKIDSIENNLKHQDIYIQNIKNILSGVIDPDSISSISDTIFVDTNNPLLQKTETEKEYVHQYEQTEKYNLSVLPANNNLPTGDIMFFKPVQGVIVEPFNLQLGHLGIGVNVADKSAVSSILDGVVFFAGYDINYGYTIQIQHSNGFVSVYKNLTSLLRKTGARVATGEAIASIDSGKNEFGKVSLIFELWYKGDALNPENYIIF